MQRREHRPQRGEQEQRRDDAQDRERGAYLVPAQVGDDQVQELHRPAPAVWRFSIRSPFSRCSIVLARSAACASCVTITIVLLNSVLSRCSNANTSCELLASS